MAGLDQEFMGDCIIAKNTRLGYLEQEPQLSPGKTVQEVVMEGVKHQQAKLDRYDQLWELLSGDLSDEEADKLNHEVASSKKRLMPTIYGSSTDKWRWLWTRFAYPKAIK